MNNGCICCTVRGDLIRIITGLMKRKGRFDAILVETTGLADPAPVAQTFFVDDEVRAKAKLDAIVTVADAKHLSQRLADAPEAKEQIAFADVIVLNKLDLVTPQELADVKARIRAINPYAKLIESERCKVDLDQVLARNAFDLDRILELAPEFLEEGHIHDHNEDVRSISLKLDRPLDAQKFFAWINRVTQERGPDILRLKGILDLKGDARRYVIQGVHMMIEGDHQRPWQEGEERVSRLVFIGRKLSRAELDEGLRSCLA